ncbi:MAG: hypothetical protein PHC34_08885 [Candidatus Gastranaerophilales bacterium]|nr:hypothetical protein [Candidatus Gastranaerophilales bacterium]
MTGQKNIINTKNNIDNKNKKTGIVQERVNIIASHMYKQFKEHNEASLNTTRMFNRILLDMEEVTESLRESFSSRGVSSSRIFCEIDADRSVGIINILWHSISFTTRGNTKPLALYREDETPLFTGRILALNGDFQDAALDIQDQEYPDILRCEIASLYVPADTTSQAILKIKHLGNKEFYINQIDASKEFLLKVLEIICGGGIYHENEPDYEDD